jgi:hypothetical protein
MESIQVSAQALDQDITRYVADPGYRAAWKAWYDNWRAGFYERYQSGWSRAGSFFTASTEDLDREIENQRTTLLGFYESYRRQVQPNGQPVPPPTGVAPQRAAPPAKGSLVPWWIWLGVGVLGVGFGYVLYRQYQRTKRQAELFETRFAPALLERAGLPGKEALEVARAGRGKDPEASSTRSTPLDLEYYARESRGYDPNFFYERGHDPYGSR